MYCQDYSALNKLRVELFWRCAIRSLVVVRYLLMDDIAPIYGSLRLILCNFCSF